MYDPSSSLVGFEGTEGHVAAAAGSDGESQNSVESNSHRTDWKRP